MVRFKTRLVDGPRGGGAFVLVPRKAADELGARGAPKIKSVIAGVPYRGSLMAMGDGTFGLGVLKAIQSKAGVGVGDVIAVELELDTEPRTVEAPPDLASALARDATVAAAWERLSYTSKKEIAVSLVEAKKAETRERRLREAIKRLGG